MLLKFIILIEAFTGQKTKETLPNSFFCRPSDLVAPDLIGCSFIRKKKNNELICGVIVETEAYSQEEPGCHGFIKKTSRNKSLFGQAGHLYVYLIYGSYNCVNIVTDRTGWASGVLIRAIAIPEEDDRIAAGPGLLAKKFDLNRIHDGLKVCVENGVWLCNRSSQESLDNITQTTRIGVSAAKDLPWRWYLKDSRSVSKRVKGDRTPNKKNAWKPSSIEIS